MKLAAGTFRIELSPRHAVDEEDWVRVQLVASAFGFATNFEAWLQLEDLRRFERQLESMYSILSGTAELSSAEPDIRLTLAAGSSGQILGTYKFESEQREGGSTALSGAFELDQSYLPALAASVRDLVAELDQRMSPNPSIERTSNARLRRPLAAAHVQRWATRMFVLLELS